MTENKEDILIEDVILSNLIYNEDYSRKIIAFLKEEYFKEFNHKNIYKVVDAYIQKYNMRPSLEAIKIQLQELDNMSDDTYFNLLEYTVSLNQKPEQNINWLLEQTEDFCNSRAVHNAMLQSLSILDGSDKKNQKGMIPKLLTDALAVTLNSSMGHDYINDAEARYDFYHNVEEKVPFDLKYLNLITKNGVSKKTLNILMAGVNVGKSLAMCHMAAANLLNGKNVLYITMEMAEERISERIDMNLLDVNTDELLLMSKSAYMSRIGRLKSKIIGNLIVQEYPTASAGAAHFRALLNELRIKKNFKPDIIYIDYLNICMSTRLKMGANVTSYTYVKTIAEEIRGLAVEYDVPIISATQVNRSGFSSSEPEMTDIAESFGLAATCDFLLSISSNDELEKLGQVVCKQLKTRYSSKSENKKFVIGIDYSKMRLFDVDNQGDLIDGVLDKDESVFDNTDYGNEADNRFKGLF